MDELSYFMFFLDQLSDLLVVFLFQHLDVHVIQLFLLLFADVHELLGLSRQ